MWISPHCYHCQTHPQPPVSVQPDLPTQNSSHFLLPQLLCYALAPTGSSQAAESTTVAISWPTPPPCKGPCNANPKGEYIPASHATASRSQIPTTATAPPQHQKIIWISEMPPRKLVKKGNKAAPAPHPLLEQSLDMGCRSTSHPHYLGWARAPLHLPASLLAPRPSVPQLQETQLTRRKQQHTFHLWKGEVNTGTRSWLGDTCWPTFLSPRLISWPVFWHLPHPLQVT